MYGGSVTERYMQAGRSHPDILIPGVVDQEDIEQALEDPRTLRDAAFGLPLVTPLEHNSWYRPTYFHERDIVEPLSYLALHKSVSTSTHIPHEQLFRQALEYAQAIGSSLVFEYSSGEEQEMRDMLAAMGAKYQYGLAEQPSPSGVPTDVIFAAEYQHQNAQLGGDLQAVYAYESGDARLRVDAVLDEGLIATSFADYERAFHGVQASNPMKALFDEQDYQVMMTSPEVIKFVYEDEDGVANMCIAHSVRHCNWINQAVVAQHFPEAYERDEVLFCPGLFSRPDAPPTLSLRTFGLAARAFAAAGVEPVVIIECNEVSARYVPRLFALGTQKTRNTHVMVSAPLQQQRVEVLQIY